MVSLSSIRQAAERISPYTHQTPIITNSYINSLCEAEVFFKCENFQKTGSFKARGASNSILKLSQQEKENGVATHSSGNHGQAMAWAAREAGVKAWVVMPSNAPAVKKAAVKAYGAEVIECEPTLEAREYHLKQIQEKTGAIFIPPYNAENTVEGQATCAVEIHSELHALDYILAPVGGGGLLSGSALATHFLSPKTKVIGCEPELVNDAWQSFKTGVWTASTNAPTLADGLKTSLGDITFKYIQEYVSDILLCSETEMVEAMRLIWERMKIIVEPSSAVVLACILKNKEIFKNQRTAVILSGGNVDLGKLPF
jgi:threonine dehydratase